MTCTHCGAQGPPEEFAIDRRRPSGRSSWCRECQSEKTNAWKASNPERVREQNRKHYRDRHRRIRDRQIGYRLQSRYGITLEDYESMFQGQNGVCAICMEPQDTSLFVDHNHETGEVRGLLCCACNFRLGSIEKPGLEAFLAYLGRYQ